MFDNFEDVSQLCQEIMDARDPVEIFGTPTGEPKEQLDSLENSYREMAEKLNPDNFLDNLDDQETATVALKKLMALYQEARKKIVLALPIEDLENGKKYLIVRELGRSEHFNLYLCDLPDGRQGILKIAATVDDNPLLDREALALIRIRQEAFEVEKENSGEKPFNYQNFFPELITSFIAEDQDGRRINILGFPSEVDFYAKLRPISFWIETAKIRIDPMTAGWILGKTLKALAFAYSLGIGNPLICGDNILIEKNQHGVIIFDWTGAEVYPNETVPEDIQGEKIAEAAMMVIDLLGGNLETGELPKNEEQLKDYRFQDFIWEMAQKKLTDAAYAHNQFYELIWSLWPRTFHPFTSYSRE